jgi:hypothetical protein
MTPVGRAAGLATTLVLLAAGMVAAFAWPGRASPWEATDRYELPLAAFAATGASVVASEPWLEVRGGGDGAAVELTQAVEFDAARFRYLRYAIRDLPPTRKRLLIWEGGATRGFTTLPDAIGERGVIDLARLPQWRGRIARIGLAVVPIDYAPAQSLPAPVFSVGPLQLESGAWVPAFGALWTEWTAHRAWTGRSNNTAGFDFSGTRGPSLPAFLMVLVCGSLVLIACWFGRVRARACALPLFVVAAALFAFEQTGQHAARSASAMAASAAVADHPDSPLAAHPPLAADAAALLRRMREDALRARLWVFGSAGFFTDYPVWLLREQDAGALPSPEQLPAQAELGGTLLVLVGRGDWGFDPAHEQPRIGTQTRAAQPYFQGPWLQVFRFPAGGDA